MKTILVVFGVFVFFWLAYAFVQAEIVPTNWKQDIRLGFVFMTTLCCIAAGLIVNIKNLTRGA